MTCSGAYATVEEFAQMMCRSFDQDDHMSVEEVELALDLSAGVIHMMLASADACECTLADWATNYLKQLNIVHAATNHSCRCVSISDEMKDTYIRWLDAQYELIRTGKIDVCSGETGAQFPAWGIAQQAHTDWAARDISFDEIMKRST